MRTAFSALRQRRSPSKMLPPQRPSKRWFDASPSSSRTPPWLPRRHLVLLCLFVAAFFLWLCSLRRPGLLSSFVPQSVSNAYSNHNSNTPAPSSCIPPPNSENPLQYALMIDAGSTGSRIHIYRFRKCAQGMPQLENESFHSLLPGLSSFANDPDAAFGSLYPLLEAAVNEVPKDVQKCTPISVKATAGLRLLGESQSKAILTTVESGLRNHWSFPVIGLPYSGEGVGIMDGKDEGVFAWITINYLLSSIPPKNSKAATAAVMDLGGASTQIVFEPTFLGSGRMHEGDNSYELRFSDSRHTLYQHSHLGYGLMQARRSTHNLAAFSHLWSARGALEWDHLTEQNNIPTPCLFKGLKKRVTLDPPGFNPVNVTMLGTGGGFEACKRIIDVTMAKDAFCDVEPCAFGGVYQPSLMETFKSGNIFALSYFYDRLIPLGLGKDNEPFTIRQLRLLTQDVCRGPDELTQWDRFSKASNEAIVELADRPEYCLDLTFMYSLLSLGYDLSDDRQLVTAKKIDDVELGWALGAAIAMLDGEIKCTA